MDFPTIFINPVLVNTPNPVIYPAVYSGVPVYEMVINDVPVMRRISDNFMNATHILKPRRTKILERDVLSGVHEKIQGGYGKYQGTWIPFDSSKSLSQKYKVEHLVQPLLDFDPAKDLLGLKPPPKIRLNPDGTRTPKKKYIKKLLTPPTSILLNSEKKIIVDVEVECSDSYSESSGDEELSPSPVEFESYSSKRGSLSIPINPINPVELTHAQRQREILLKICNDNTNSLEILNFLRTTTLLFDSNYSLDMDGNSVIHWAASFGRVDLLKELTVHGANLAVRNALGQTGLSRAVIHVDNYHLQSFEKLLGCFEMCIFSLDNEGKSFLHHILSRLETSQSISDFDNQVSIYYFTSFIKYFEDNQTFSLKKLRNFLTLQDKIGDSFLHYACKYKIYGVLDVLLKFGLDLDLTNLKGESPVSYSTTDRVLRKLLNSYLDEPLSPISFPKQLPIKRKMIPISRFSARKNCSNLIVYLEKECPTTTPPEPAPTQ